MAKPKIVPEDYFETFTVLQVSIKFGVSERIVRDWIGDCSLRAKKIGRQFYITKAELKRFVAPEGYEDDQEQDGDVRAPGEGSSGEQVPDLE